MNAKEYLRQYEYAAFKANQCREQYELMMEKIDAIGSTLGTDGMPHGSGVSRKTEDLAIKLGEAAQRYLDAEQEAFDIKEQVYSMIADIEGYPGQVLYERYINLSKWQEISDILIYSLPALFKFHEKGLSIVEERLKNLNNE